MYNGIGLKTSRGSGTNGYTQANKFFSVKRKSSSNLKVATKILEGDRDGVQGFGGSKKIIKEILEHERKCQIEVKLMMLEDRLSDHGYTDDEISRKLDEARKAMEEKAAAAASASASASAEDTTHEGRRIAQNKWN